MKIDEIMYIKIQEIVKIVINVFFDNLENDDILSSENMQVVANYIVVSSASIVSSLMGTYVKNAVKEGRETETYNELMNMVIEILSSKNFFDGEPVKEH